MKQLRCEITRWLSDEPQPGWVEAKVIDATGHAWVFEDKSAVLTEDDLSATSGYPVAGSIACEVVARADTLVTVAIDDVMLDVYADQLL